MEKTSYFKNLKLLWWLRNIAIIGQAAAILLVTRGLNIELPIIPLWGIIGTLIIINVLTIFQLKTGKTISKFEFFFQLLIDMTALFGLLYFSGGAANPFTSLFILQVIIAAVTLPPSYAWTAAAISIAFYTTLMFFSIEVPYFQHHHTGDFFNLHMQGMWISFILLAGIISWFVVRMNITIRRQDALLAEAEKIAAVGMLAANAAHELGTPLATMAVLAEDCEAKKSRQFSEQLSRCKQILSRIAAAAGVARAESGSATTLDVFLSDIVSSWKNDNPAVAFTANIQKGDSLEIVAEYGLKQAITNLLDNAADISPEFVQLDAKWTGQSLNLTIQDKGRGIPPEILHNIGEAGFTTKLNGLGLGLFLARSVIIRLEGSLDFKKMPGGGTIAAINIPIKRIAT